MNYGKPHFKANFKKNANKNGAERGSRPVETFDLRIERMVQGGDGLARLPDGRVCFVARALPGELCKVALTVNKKDFTKGVVRQVLEASPDRVTPPCKLYGKCGGCSLQHLESSRQAMYLEQVERDNFKRLSKRELPPDFKIHTGSPFGYRNRARVTVCKTPNGLKFGFREQESNATIPFDSCPVLTKNLNEFLKQKVQEKGENTLVSRLFKARSELNVFDNGSGLVCYHYKGMPFEEFERNSVNVVGICGSKIEMDASVFFQSNLGLLPELVEAVRNAVDEGIQNGEASNEWLIDLFSGVGFFAALLKDKFKRVTTVERDDGCLCHAKVNLDSENNSNVDNVSAPAEDWLIQNVVDVPATLIVDPPRTGLPKEALEAIIKSSVNRLIYVSCDPVTLARDYAKFADAGFVLKRAEGFAFYPQTPHMEMFCVLSR